MMGGVAEHQLGLISRALDTPQANKTHATLRLWKVIGFLSSSTLELSAHHMGILNVPVIIQDSAPHTVEGDLNSPITAALTP